MKHITKLAISILLSALTAGCVSSYHGQYEREEAVVHNTLAMTKQDVIDLSKEGIGDDVIISQIKATNSYFELSTNDIVELKKAGVSKKVVSAVIKTSAPSKTIGRVRRNAYPPYSYTAVTGYPWYRPYYFGYGYGFYPPYGSHYYPLHYGGYYSGHGYSGGYYGGGLYSGGGFGGHRSFGSHR